MNKKKCKICKFELDISNFRLMNCNGYTKYQSYCKNCEKIYQKTHRKQSKVKDNYLTYQKKWRENNKNLKNEIQKRYTINNEMYKYCSRLRQILRRILNKKGKTRTKYEDIIGISCFDLYKHLIRTFEERYNIKYSENIKVEIDHIVPLSFAKSIQEVEALNYWTNLQLLTPKDNKKKYTNNL